MPSRHFQQGEPCVFSVSTTPKGANLVRMPTSITAVGYAAFGVGIAVTNVIRVVRGYGMERIELIACNYLTT